MEEKLNIMSRPRNIPENQTEKLPDVGCLVLPCRFCGELPNWDELSPNHRWRSKRYASWDGWLTHECKAKYYALAGAKKYVYEDWNFQQND